MMLLWQSNSLNAADNLAYEERLLNAGKPGVLLWQSTPAVIVGRHQIIADEVRQIGIPVYRRISGGGAVYMDEGNINIAFFGETGMNKAIDILSEFLKTLNIQTQSSGNDITVNEHKISGWAAIKRNGITMAHGTLMFNVNLDILEKVLTPSAYKLQRHGLKSVRARVGNLEELLPNLTFKDFYHNLSEYLVDYAKGDFCCRQGGK